MKLKHKVNIMVCGSDGKKKSVLQSGMRHLPHRLIKRLFGDYTAVLLLKPGESVDAVEIHEVKAGDSNEIV